MGIESVQLRNGGRLILRSMPDANSVSIGIFSLVGLHQEPENCNGISHFLEHMSFKGTNKRTARKITESVDHLGAHINAHTTKEYTCYYMTVLPHSVTKAMDILFDLFVNSSLDQKDIDLEKNVVLEEINMYEDTPDDLIHDTFSSSIWGGSKLGRPILGTEASLENITKETLTKFKRHYLNPKNLIISVAGKIPNKTSFINKIENYCSFLEETESFYEHQEKPKLMPIAQVHHKDIEQIHFCLGTEGISFSNEDHYKVTMLATILGGSMSSRLFQKIRERRAWAYSVYAYASFYYDSGLFTVYGGVNKDKFIPSMRIVLKEFNHLREKCISSRELRKVKEQLKGNLVLSLEQSSSWMNWMGRSTMYFDKVLSVDTVIDKIESVTVQDIQEISAQIFQPSRLALAAIGPISKNILELDKTSVHSFLESCKLNVL